MSNAQIKIGSKWIRRATQEVLDVEAITSEADGSSYAILVGETAGMDRTRIAIAIPAKGVQVVFWRNMFAPSPLQAVPVEIK